MYISERSGKISRSSLLPKEFDELVGEDFDVFQIAKMMISFITFILTSA